MGVIQRQSIKNNLIQYLSVAVGAVSTILVYPNDLEAHGVIQALLGWALLGVPIASLGLGSVITRYFPYHDESAAQRAAFFSFAMLIGALGILLLVLLATLLLPLLRIWLAGRVDLSLLYEYGLVIIGLLSVLTYTSLLDVYIRNFNRITVQAIFMNLLPKLGLPVAFLFYLGDFLSLRGLAYALLGIYALGLLGLIWYQWHLGQLRFNWRSRDLRRPLIREMATMAGYSILGGIGSIVAMRIDTISVSSLVGDVATGVYSIAQYVALTISIPARAILGISSPIIAKAWKENDLAHIRFLYRESSLVLFAGGGLIFVFLLAALPDIYLLTSNPQAVSTGLIATLFLGGAQLFDLLTSINSQIISYSKYYRINLAFVLVLAVLNVTLNYFFIRTLDFGLTGAAISTFVSIGLYNILKGLYIYGKLRMQPFSPATVYVALLLLVMAGVLQLIPDLGYLLLNIGAKGLAAVTMFAAFVWWTDLIPPFKRMMQDILRRMRGYFGAK